MMRLFSFVLLMALAQYKPALPGYRFEFPRDHGAHPEYKLEWWYFTGHISDANGKSFGYELTFFRNALDQIYENPSRWNIRDVYMAHFAITDVSGKKFQYFEKLNRAGPGIAGAAVGTLNTWNENWSAQFEGETIKLKAAAEQAAIELTLTPRKPPSVHGVDGVSQKAEGDGRASHYYSMTRLDTLGNLRIAGQTFQVTGSSWMDHEFGTNQLAEQQIGWDWFSIQLDNGADLMLYQMRNRDGTLDSHSSGTIVERNLFHLTAKEFTATPGRRWRSPGTGISYPVEWTISIPARRIALRITPMLDAQELVTTRSTGIAYWEGAVVVTGTWDGAPMSGRGYVELTGYDENHRPRV